MCGLDLMMFTLITLLDISVSRMHKGKSTLFEENAFLKAKNERLNNIIRLLKRDKFGAKSQKSDRHPRPIYF